MACEFLFDKSGLVILTSPVAGMKTITKEKIASSEEQSLACFLFEASFITTIGIEVHAARSRVYSSKFLHQKTLVSYSLSSTWYLFSRCVVFFAFSKLHNNF